MAKVTVRKETGKLVIDFTHRGVRCREQTALPDTQANRKRVQAVIDKIKKAQQDGEFKYSDYFPGSALVARFDSATAPVAAVIEATSEPVATGPLFKDFANTWVDEHSIEWRRSHIRSLLSTLNGRLIPHFGGKAVGSISKSDILVFRATLAKVKGRGEKEGLSPKRINEIIGLLRQILTEAADRFQFTSPARAPRNSPHRGTGGERKGAGLWRIHRIAEGARTRAQHPPLLTPREQGTGTSASARCRPGRRRPPALVVRSGIRLRRGSPS